MPSLDVEESDSDGCSALGTIARPERRDRGMLGKEVLHSGREPARPVPVNDPEASHPFEKRGVDRTLDLGDGVVYPETDKDEFREDASRCFSPGHRPPNRPGAPGVTSSGGRFLAQVAGARHEFIFHFTPGGRTPLDRRAIGVPYQDQSNVKRWAAAGEGVRCRGNTWFIPYETIQSRDRYWPHPASFPSKIPEQCLRLHGIGRAGVVLDPFMGLGSTAIAAVRLGLDFVGIEMDEHYLHEAIERVQAEE